MTNQKHGLFTNNSFMALHGLASVMIGTTLPEMIRSFGLNLSQGGFIVTAQSAGGLLIMFAGMVLADRVRKPIWIVSTVAAAGLSIAAIGVSPGYWFLVVVFFVTGVIVQLLDTLLNAFTGDIAPGSRTRELNILHMLYGIGAFVGPTFARWLLDRSVSWSGVYWIVGAIYLGAAAVSLIWIRTYVSLEAAKGRRAAASSSSESRTEAPGPADGTTPPVTSGQWLSVTLLGMVVLFYAVHQLSTVSWLPMYMESILGVRAGVASAALSLYWLGIIASRFLASMFGSRLGEIRILIWGSVLGGIALMGAVLLASPVMAVAGFVIAGVATGATIPLTMALAYGHIPGRTGAVTSVVYGLMVVGRLFGPWLVGSVGDRLGLDSGIMIAAVVLLVAGAAAAVVAIRDRRTRPARPRQRT